MAQLALVEGDCMGVLLPESERHPLALAETVELALAAMLALVLGLALEEALEMAQLALALGLGLALTLLLGACDALGLPLGDGGLLGADEPEAQQPLALAGALAAAAGLPVAHAEGESDEMGEA